MEVELMIEGSGNASVSPNSDVPGASAAAGSDSDRGRFVGRNATALSIENRLAERIRPNVDNLNSRDVVACRGVNLSWQTSDDVSSLQAEALALCQRLHYQPIAQVEHYHSFTRGWLTGFSDRGKEYAGLLDQLLEH